MGHHVRMHAQTDSAMPETDAQHIRRITSFRSRRSSLTEAQQEIWDRLWPSLGRLAIPAGTPEDAEIVPEPLDIDGWFGRANPAGGQARGLVCEIGCGTGTSTLAMAQAEPDVDVIAVEVYRRGLAQLLSAIDRTSQDAKPVTNIRLMRGDAVDVLEHLLPPASLTGVRVYFPDPWPKSRHHKRRLLQPEIVRLIAERLRPGGVLHAATDHAGYALQIAGVGDAEPLLRRVAPGDELPISVQRPTTKYETKAHHVGSAVTELVWVRRG